MKNHHLSTKEEKAEAIRIAIKEGLEHLLSETKHVVFISWAGLGNQITKNKINKFLLDDDLWK